MVDPNLILSSLKGAGWAGKAVRRWLAGGEFDRLLGLLDKRFGDETGLSLTQLETWKGDVALQTALFAISETGDWDKYRPALREAIRVRVAQDPEAPSEEDEALTSAVVLAIEKLLPYAKQGDELTRFEARQTRSDVGRVRVRVATTDWVPERAQDIVRELLAAEPDLGTKLEDTLASGEAGGVVTGLIRTPPPWVEESQSGLLFEALAALAESFGRWSDAVSAWRGAAGRPGGDRVRALVRGSIAAYVSGDATGGEQLLADARAIEPDHPLVLLRDVQLENDPERKLELLGRVNPRNQRQAAHLHAHRAHALALKQDWDEADAALANAPKDVAADWIDEVRARITVLRNKEAWLRGERVDGPALVEAAEAFRRFRDEHRELRAFAGSVAYLVEAADAYVRADRHDEAEKLLDPSQVLSEELVTPRAREQLAEQALRCQRYDLVHEFLPDEYPRDDAGLLLRAAASIHSGSGDALDSAVADLDRFIADGELATAAAVPRLIASIHRGCPWSAEAERVLRGEDEVLASLLRARWLAANGDYPAAERELLANPSEPRVQHMLIEVARMEGQIEKVRRRANELLGSDSEYSVQVDAARALLGVGDEGPAASALNQLAENLLAPPPIRLAALSDLTQLAATAGKHQEVVRLTTRWLELDPRARRAAWTRAHALFRLGHFGEALATVEDRGFMPESTQEAQLAARLYGLVLPPVEALERIVGLADSQTEPDEDLEMLGVVAAIRTHGQAPRHLLERTSPARFLEMFPDTTLMHAVPAPETDEEIREFIRTYAGQHTERTRDLTREVFETGKVPVAALAHVTGKALGELWGRFYRLPLGYGDEVLDGLERSDASQAIGIGAVWDPSSLFVAVVLDGDASKTFRAALQTSVICQSTMDDVLVGAADLNPGDERMEVGVDECGEPTTSVWTRDEITREDRRRRRTIALAQRMAVEPDAPESDSSAEAAFMREQDVPNVMKTYAGSIAVARRLDLALYSDDRLVRIRARQAGLRVFGSLALVDALTDGGYLSHQERLDLRCRLRSAGAIGTRPSQEELVNEARASNFRLTQSLGIALTDRFFLGTQAATVLNAWIALLRAAYEEEPTTFDAWVARSIDAFLQLGGRRAAEAAARGLILLSWDLEEPANTGFFQELVRSISRAATVIGSVGDPLLAAARLLAAAIGDSGFPAPVVIATLRQAADQVPVEHRLKIRLELFFKPTPPTPF